MSKTKKILMFFFLVAFVVNLQLTGTLSSGMNNGFSLDQLADNIFTPSAFADEGGIMEYDVCDCYWPYCGYACGPTIFYTWGCDPGDPDWGCYLCW
jgi:hypothetical protein